MTDPRTALAADLGHDLWYLQDKANKRGVLLVPADVVQAVADYPWGLHLAGTPNEQEALGLIERLRAALSAEVTEPKEPKRTEKRSGSGFGFPPRWEVTGVEVERLSADD